jgi:serine/threonine protein kinase
MAVIRLDVGQSRLSSNQGKTTMGLKKNTELRTAFESYSVTEQIGAGGAGEVYKVADGEGKNFAIKILNKDTADAKKLRRFRNEINFCSKPIHKNVIQIIDRGLAPSGETFYVMPLYSGTLQNLIEKSISHDKILPYFGKVLDGVEAAHLLGSWHRDLKPKNILHDQSSDELIVADFGIAKFNEDMIMEAVETSLGDKLANFSHCAPEQKIRGAKIGSQADVYALGLMLNEMFTGKIPAGTGFARIQSVGPGYEYLDGIVDQMLRQNPSDRPSISQVKSEIIARGASFLSLQKLDRLRNEVISESEIEDPVVRDPIRAIGTDFQNGQLVFKLSQVPPPNWVMAFKNPNAGWSSVMGSGPEYFSFDGDIARVPMVGGNPQIVVNHTKNYIDMANKQYEELVRRDVQNRINAERARQRKMIADEEHRRSILERISL